MYCSKLVFFLNVFIDLSCLLILFQVPSLKNNFIKDNKTFFEIILSFYFKT